MERREEALHCGGYPGQKPGCFRNHWPTSQQPSLGRLNYVETHVRYWSDSDRNATIGPLSTSIRSLQSGQILRSSLDWCSSPEGAPRTMPMSPAFFSRSYAVSVSSSVASSRSTARRINSDLPGPNPVSRSLQAAARVSGESNSDTRLLHPVRHLSCPSDIGRLTTPSATQPWLCAFTWRAVFGLAGTAGAAKCRL
jgi:hypothetical protein